MLKKVFNYIAGKPSSQFTLGGDINSVHFNRAGRAVERIGSIPWLLKGGAMMALSVPALLLSPPAGLVLATSGFLVAAFGKVGGMVAGGIAHVAASAANGVVNHFTTPKAPQPQ
jgi:hypothetical protein